MKIKIFKSQVCGDVYGFYPDDNGPINQCNSLKTTPIMHSNGVTSFPIVISEANVIFYSSLKMYFVCFKSKGNIYTADTVGSFLIQSP